MQTSSETADTAPFPRWRVPVVDPLARWLETVCMTLSGAALVIMMLLITVDTTMRYFLNSPLIGATEVITRFLMVGAVWLAMAPTERMGGHVGIDLLMRRAPAVLVPWAALLTRLCSLFIIGIICWVTFYKTLDTWGSSTTGVIRLPIGPSWGLVTLGSALLTLRLALEAVGDLGEVVATVTRRRHAGGAR